MVHHPDRGGNPERFDDIQKAYAVVLEEANKPKSCIKCSGTGRVSITSGWSKVDLFCGVCNGSGTEI